MIDVKELKNILTTENIINLLFDLGADYNVLNDNEIHFKSICHDSSSYKLYYYIETKSFYCHRCGKAFDAISLVQYMKNIEFKEAIAYICKLFNIDNYANVEKSYYIDDWQSMLKFMDKKPDAVNNILHYDKSILSKCKPWYHQSFIDDGISIDTMKKYGILFYQRTGQIVIPVYDIDNNFIGTQVRNTIMPYKAKYDCLRALDGEEYKLTTSNVLYGYRENSAVIEASKECILCEAPKGVMQFEDILDKNISLALFGMSCNKQKRDIILSLGVEKLYIAIDKQYKMVYNGDVLTDEFIEWRNKVKKIANLFKPYCEVWLIWDDGELLNYKDSPSDHQKETWNKLRRSKL